MPVNMTEIADAVVLINGKDLGFNCTHVRWTSFLNNGYIISMEIQDPLWSKMKQLVTDFYLAKARHEPTVIELQLKWRGRPEFKTAKRKAILVELVNTGISSGGLFKFVAVDPPSWFLSAGDSDGSAYKGNVGEVIKKVAEKYTAKSKSTLVGEIKVEVSKTNDAKTNIWHMMRQDPLSFIYSLMDWSSSLTNGKTNWVTASVDNKLIIQEQTELDGTDFGIYSVDARKGAIEDVYDFTTSNNNMLSLVQTRLITQGISAISEQYLDKITDNQYSPSQKKVTVLDDNTEKKYKTDIGPDKGFKKPDSIEFSTNLFSVPEHNGGDVGIPYSQYIDGRIRKKFMDLVPMVMRIKIRVPGDYRIHDSSILGASTCTINWVDTDNQRYFLSGNWIIYGFDHQMNVGAWSTDLYLYRLDYDAKAVPPKTTPAQVSNA